MHLVDGLERRSDEEEVMVGKPVDDFSEGVQREDAFGDNSNSFDAHNKTIRRNIN